MKYLPSSCKAHCAIYALPGMEWYWGLGFCFRPYLRWPADSGHGEQSPPLLSHSVLNPPLRRSARFPLLLLSTKPLSTWPLPSSAGTAAGRITFHRIGDRLVSRETAMRAMIFREPSILPRSLPTRFFTANSIGRREKRARR